MSIPFGPTASASPLSSPKRKSRRSSGRISPVSTASLSPKLFQKSDRTCNVPAALILGPDFRKTPPTSRKEGASSTQPLPLRLIFSKIKYVFYIAKKPKFTLSFVKFNIKWLSNFQKKRSGRVSVSGATLQMGQIPNPHQDYIVEEILCHVKSSNF